MNANEMRGKILAYNRSMAAKSEKAADMDVLITALAKLPPGQLKKVLTDEVIAVIAKYAITLE